MKVMNKVLAVTMIGAMLFSVTSCAKKFKKIDDDDLIDAFEDIFDWEEGYDYRESKDYDLWGTNFEDVDDPYIYDVKYVQGAEFNEEDYMTYAYVAYAEFEDKEEAEEYFLLYYDVWAKDKKDVEQAYHKGDWGYFIESNEKDHFSAYYFVEDTVVEVSSFDEEGVKQLKQLLKSFGYPC